MSQNADIRNEQMRESLDVMVLALRDLASVRGKSAEDREKWKTASGEAALNIFAVHIEALFKAAAALMMVLRLAEANAVLAAAQALLSLSGDAALADFYAIQLGAYQKVMTKLMRDVGPLDPVEIIGLRKFGRAQLSADELDSYSPLPIKPKSMGPTLAQRKAQQEKVATADVLAMERAAFMADNGGRA